MKKLLCVRLPDNVDERSPKLSIGTIYTGIETRKREDIVYWRLQEMEDGKFLHWYDEGCFSELGSGLDETERMSQGYINRKNDEYHAKYVASRTPSCYKPC